MNELTVDMVMRLDPCYTRDQVEKAAGGRTSMTLIEACDLDVPATDLLWLLLRKEFLPEPALGELACVFAERALLREREHGREPDARSWAALAVKRRWLRGEATDSELAAAWAAADAAAWAAADPAWAAANAAAKAARNVADAAADAADWAARDARDAERKWQLQQVRSALLLLDSGPAHTEIAAH
jgi:hypothetical protein